jgi:hypothetical protein
MRTRLLICMSFLFFGCFAQAQLAAVGDLKGDGKPDVVVTDRVQPRIGVFLNTGNGSLGPGTFLATSIRSGKQVILASQNHSPQGTFGSIIVHLNPPILTIAHQSPANDLGHSDWRWPYRICGIAWSGLPLARD